MKLKTLRSAKPLRNKRVILRCDLNVAMASGKIEPSDVWRLQALVPTIRYLVQRKAAVVLISHRGRPKGKDHDQSLRPICKKLSSLAKVPIDFWSDDMHRCIDRSKKLVGGQVVCLENIRFYKEEEKNDDHFARKLALLGDIYVDDAFGNIHRAHASMSAITRHMPSFAGPLLAYELKNLDGLLERARHPIVAVVGGSKISTKIRLLKRLLRQVDYVLLGGALANNILAAMGYNIGQSKHEADMVTWSKSLLSNKLKVPVDARVARSLKAKPRIAALGKVGAHDMILDIGPDTVRLYTEVILRAKTIIWNGPMGLFEDPRYAMGTAKLVEALKQTKGQSYVGGGETVKAVLQQRAQDSLTFVSTGGGAMLAVLEGRPLPALRRLVKK